MAKGSPHHIHRSVAEAQAQSLAIVREKEAPIDQLSDVEGWVSVKSASFASIGGDCRLRDGIGHNIDRIFEGLAALVRWPLLIHGSPWQSAPPPVVRVRQPGWAQDTTLKELATIRNVKIHADAGPLRYECAGARPREKPLSPSPA